MRVSSRLEALLLSPLGLLLLVTILVPGGVLLAYSFFDFDGVRASAGFTFESYREVFTQGTYATFAVNTIAIALPTMALSVAGGFAVAYWLVFRANRLRNVVLALVVLSMMASYLVRIYAWRTLMGENGIINSALERIGVIDEPLGFLLFSRFAAIVAETNLLLPFAALLVYARLSGIAAELHEASRDLGSGRLETLQRVTLPLAGKAILGALVFTFFLSCADYVTPVLLGGNDGTTFGTVVSDQLRISGNYPLGAALSFVTVGAFVLFAVIARGALRAIRWLPAAA